MKIENGIISNWNEEKGFGFITPKSGGKSVFFHINSYSYDHRRPLKNLQVQYFTSKDPRGRVRAIDVIPFKGHKKNRREIKQKFSSVIVFISFSGVLFYLFQSKLVPLELICVYVIFSFFTFLMYAKDKTAAELGEWRTTESSLHIASLMGGWPGAALAQSFLRHKSKKKSFRISYWTTVIANCGCLYWFVTPKGNLWLKTIIRKLYLLVNQLIY